VEETVLHSLTVVIFTTRLVHNMCTQQHYDTGRERCILTSLEVTAAVRTPNLRMTTQAILSNTLCMHHLLRPTTVQPDSSDASCMVSLILLRKQASTKCHKLVQGTLIAE
jgi:hypothetical protein